MSVPPARRLVVRRLTHLEPALLTVLVEYGRSALGESALDEWMLPVIASCGLLYVGRLDEEIVGSAEIIRCLESDDLYLEGFYIRPGFQRQGLGNEFLTAVSELLSDNECRRLLATVSPENEAGRRLYEKAGFRETEYLPDHFGSGRHRLLLAKTLLDPART